MWKLFRKPAPVDPEVFEEPPAQPAPVRVRSGWDVDPTPTRLNARKDALIALLAASCADASEPVDKFLQLYDRAQKYLEALDKRA